MRMRGFLILCLALTIPARVAAAADSPDLPDGRDPSKYPPDTPVDFQHLLLDLTFADPRSKSFTGRATYTFRPVQPSVRRLVLDAVDLQITRVTRDSGAQRDDLLYDYDGRHLLVHFPEPLPQDKDVALSIDYRCIDPAAGMIFALPEPDSTRGVVIHTQGETEFARYWFPCLDSPVDRLTTETRVSVPRSITVISNGELIERIEPNPVAEKSVVWHYRQNVPHVVYLVSLVIGEFECHTDTWRGIPVQYFYAPGREREAVNTYRRTPEMIEQFSTLLGVDYPYAKYSQVNVPLFEFGGMENISATTMAEHALLDDRALLDTDLEGLVSHELAHQWFGDLLTCRSWDHIWLNEGFATFMASVWTEHSKGRAEYDAEFWSRINGVAAADLTDSGKALVFRDYTQAFEPFFHKGSLAYSKGSCLLHMLRHQLGDELFWKALHEYVTAHRAQLVETDDLRAAFERVTGRSFEQFFRQWAFRRGVPKLKVKYSWSDADKLAEISVTQTQPISRETPAFVLPLDVLFRTGDQAQRATMQVDAKESVYRKRLESKPELVCIDPDGGVLAGFDVDLPKPMWLEQLADGPTVARLRAMQHFRSDKSDDVVEALLRILNDPDALWSLRNECAAALGEMQLPHVMQKLSDALGSDGGGIAGARVRRAIVDALGRYETPEAAEVLMQFARSDPAYGVEAAATAALGRTVFGDVTDILLANAEKDSYNDEIRRAALQALADRDLEAGIEPALNYAAHGHYDRIRPDAIRVLGRLGRHKTQTDRVRRFLTGLIMDPEPRARRAALDAFGELGAPQAAAVLRGVADGGADSATRDTARGALGRLGAAPPDTPAAAALRREIGRLRDEFQKIQDRLKSAESKLPTQE